MYIPNELIEQFARGNGVVFVGEDLSIGAGLPSKSDLKNSLARELIGYPQDSTYEDIVRYHENEFGRNRLVTRLREELDTSQAYSLNYPTFCNPKKIYSTLSRL